MLFCVNILYISNKFLYISKIDETTSMQILLEGSPLPGLAFRPDFPYGSVVQYDLDGGATSGAERCLWFCQGLGEASL